MDGILQPGVTICETILHRPIYFGQKDLSSTGDGFQKDLVDKLLGSGLDKIRRDIDLQKQRVIESIDRMMKAANVDDLIAEQKQIKQDAEHRLDFYKKHGVEEKLQKRLDYESDIRKIGKGVELAKNFVTDLENLLANYEDDIKGSGIRVKACNPSYSKVAADKMPAKK